jgi:MFS family permease
MPLSSAPTAPATARGVNTARQILFASLVGTTIEFFDFYIYATAAVLVFPKLFFPASDPASATLASLATFGIAFLARPIGSALFGHFGDRVGEGPPRHARGVQMRRAPSGIEPTSGSRLRAPSAS